MSKRRPRSDEEESVPPPEAERNREHESSPPIITRTRSGRRVRAPAALLESELRSSVKTPSRRAKKSVIPEECADNEETGAGGAESGKPTSVCPNDKSLNPGLDPETEKREVDPAGPSEVNQVFLHTNEENRQETLDSSRTAILPEELIVSDISLQTHGNGEKEPHVHQLTQVRSGSERKTGSKSGQSKSSMTRLRTIPLGKPKSGRVWKDRNKHKFSALLRDKPLHTSWGSKMEAKREKELLKSFSMRLKEEKAREKEEKRKRREETLKRREANERKAEIVQVIRNTAKIKRMKKKQLRKIEKRDTLAFLQKSQPRSQNAASKGRKGSQ